MEAFGADIDTLVGAISLTYDSMGRKASARSLASTDSSILDEVALGYSAMGQIATVRQNPYGAVALTSPVVTYTYQNVGLTSGNYSRLMSHKYPSGLTITNGTTTLDQALGRVPNLAASGVAGHLAQYSFLGANSPIKVAYPTPAVQLDPTAAIDGIRASGRYPGFDRFGRAQLHTWADTSYGGGASGIPNMPPVFSRLVRFTKSGNVAERLDARPGTRTLDNDLLMTHDGLDRLLGENHGARNTLVPSAPWTFGPGSKAWTLDSQGNWDELMKDLGPNASGQFGTFGDSLDKTETRTHDQANTLVQLRPDQNLPAVPLTYDAAGNAKVLQRQGAATRTLVHDAWNRLVKVTDDSNTPTAYRYNAAHWRTSVLVGGANGGTITTSYFSAAWRVVQEEVATAANGLPGVPKRRSEMVWGIRYIDDAVARRVSNYVEVIVVPEAAVQMDQVSVVEGAEVAGGAQPEAVQAEPVVGETVGGEIFQVGAPTWYYYITDSQYNVAALVDATGALVERLKYDSYGTTSHQWAGDTNDDGAVNMLDVGEIVGRIGNGIADANYRPDCDINRDGQIDTTDMMLVGPDRAPLASGLISDPDGAMNDIGWRGYRHDAATNWYSVRYRWYAPEYGRWLQRDPITYLGGLNLYGYVDGMPWMYTDPLGLMPWYDRLLDHSANFAAGFGDSLSFGVTDMIREYYDINDTVDHSSKMYIAGEATEIAAELVLTAGSSAAKTAVKRAMADSVARGFKTPLDKLVRERATRMLKREGHDLTKKFVHHLDPLKGHPVDGFLKKASATFPSLGRNPNARRNLMIVTKRMHMIQHQVNIALEYIAEATFIGNKKAVIKGLLDGLRHWLHRNDDNKDPC